MRPPARGGRGGGGMKGRTKVVAEPHKHEGVFIAKVKKDCLLTKNLVPGEAVYGEKCVAVQSEDGTKLEYRVWNPFRSKLAPAILCGLVNFYIVPGVKKERKLPNIQKILNVKYKNEIGEDLINFLHLASLGINILQWWHVVSTSKISFVLANAHTQLKHPA
ncbi:hypothetical protein IFM89_031444 [Coptis chinensis]|uniref:Uncharacterized protein n=1 Tax=Coptis chinensis TaxID=261450 RepID=A0A835HGT6_9MAGN|nr:hypothetical protein IFM89_031444 [Coptis chinensis]